MGSPIPHRREALGAAGSSSPHQRLAGARALAAALRRLRHAKAPPSPKIDLVPGYAFGAVVDERLKEVEHQIGEVKDRLNGLIYLVIGAVVVEVVLRLIK